MGHSSRRLGLAATALATAALATVLVSGQSTDRKGLPDATPKASTTWRAPWGHPDLQGVWTNATFTPLERPAVTGEAHLLSAAELQREEEAAARNLSNEPAVLPGDPGTYNAFWRDPIKPTGRTSLIVDPPDGPIRPLTPEGNRIHEARAADVAALAIRRFDTPKDAA